MNSPDQAAADPRQTRQLCVDAFEIGNAGQIEAQVVGEMLGASMEFAKAGILPNEAQELIAEVLPAMKAAYTNTRLWGLDASGVVHLRAFHAVFERQLALATPEQIDQAVAAVRQQTAVAAQIVREREGDASH